MKAMFFSVEGRLWEKYAAQTAVSHFPGLRNTVRHAVCPYHQQGNLLLPKNKLTYQKRIALNAVRLSSSLVSTLEEPMRSFRRSL